MKRVFLILTLCLLALSFALTLEGAAAESEGYFISADGDGLALSLSGEVIKRGEIGYLLSEIPDGASVVFESVELNSSLEIPRGNYTLSGDIRFLSGGITVREGTALLISRLRLDASTNTAPAINVRGGSVRIVSSEIVGGGATAILSDYSVTSTLVIENSSVTTASSDAAVRLLSGSLSVISGSIKNTLGTAIESRAALSLAGEPELWGLVYDVCADRPVSLAVCDTPYAPRYTLDLMYDGVFSEGEAYEIFSRATEESISRASVFDKNGKEYGLSYFAESPSDGERSVAMVYLPFAVRFSDGAGEVSTVYALRGETVTPPDAPQRAGYEFLCWHTASGNEFDLSSPINANITLYSKYRLLSPSFKISSLSAVYTGDEHILAFSEVTHPLDALGGFSEFVWYKSDEVVSRGNTVSVRTVSDSGVYSCLITYYYESDSSSVLVEDVSVTVSPKEITPPELSGDVYDGTPKRPAGIDGNVFEYNCDGFTDAGVYEIALTLKDAENCVFLGTDSATATVRYEIVRAENRFTVPPTVKSVYEGTALDIKCEALHGEVHFIFSDALGGEFSASVPTVAGRYYLRASVAESGNYEALLSEPVAFEIMADFCVSLEITEREQASYSAFDRFVGDGVLLLARYKSGREESIGMASLSVRYQRGSYLRYGDSGVILSYGGVSITYPLIVAKADYPLDTLDFSECRITYDGRYHEYSLETPSVVGRDNIPLTVRAIGGGTGAGEYTVRIVFSSESTDYNLPDERESVLIIEPHSTELSWERLDFVYDGTKKKPICSYTDVFGIVRYPEVYGERTNAGSGYTAYVNIENGNYIFTNESVQFEIRKGSYDLSSVRWQGGEFVYNGTEQSVTLVGLPSGVSVVGYTDASERDAGSYLAYATLVYDAENYERPEIEPCAWTIHKASYELSDFKIENNTVVFDGNEHYPRVTGNVPVGFDGIELCYTFSRGVVHVADGSVGVRVEFSTDSQNYVTPEARVVYVTVTPKEIEVVWHGSELTFSGGALLPRAECAECEIEVLGAGINAGEYTATARSKNSDYTVKNSSFAFRINKAENRFIGEIRVNDVYTGREITHGVSTLFGEPEIGIYSDRDCTAPCEITVGGTYYLVFEVSESDNYTGLRSEAIEIQAIDLAVTDITAVLSRTDFVAFERLTDEDVVFTVLYNDGRSIRCEISEINVIYQRGDSFRRGDTEVILSFEGFETRCTVSVDYAQLDLSGLFWEGLTHTYDGTEKYPTPIGLPEGLTLSGFAESTCINAGEYHLTPILSYDTENYAVPTPETVKMVINKQIVSSPSDFSVEYDGRSHNPMSENALYSLAYTGDIRSVGKYEVRVVLSDGENYELSDGDCILVSVLPRKIYITVSEAVMLSDGSLTDVMYEITEGSVVEGEELSFVPEMSDDGVTLKCNNANYELIVTPGEVIESRRALGDLKVVLITVGIALLLLLIAALIYGGRRRIFRRYIIAATPAPLKESAPAPVKIIDIMPEPQREEAKKEEDALPKKEEEPTDDDGDKGANDLMERAEKIGKVEIDMEKADELITDALAKDLVKRAEKAIRTTGCERSVINVDTLSEYFYPGERVDINILKRRGLIPQDVSFLKVLARGRVDKPLSVYANEFTPAAVKMIVLSGGEAVKAQTIREKDG